MCAMPGISSIAMSQPEYNDMEKIFRNTVDKGIKLIGFSNKYAEEFLKQGRCFHGNLHV